MTDREPLAVSLYFWLQALASVAVALVLVFLFLGRLTPVDPADPVGSKKRTVALSKELQAKFSEKFGALRCQDLLGGGKFVPDERTPAAARMGLTGHCDIMIVTAVEIVEEILNQRG